MIVEIVGLAALTSSALGLGYFMGWTRRGSLVERRGMRR